MQQLPLIKIVKRFCLYLAVGFGLLATHTSYGQSRGLPDSVGVDETITTGTHHEAIDTVATATVIDSSSAAINSTDTTSVLTTDSVVLRIVPDSVIKKYKADPDFAYANDPEYWKRQPPPAPGPFLLWLLRVLASPITRIVIYVLLGAALAYALFRIIADNRLYLFYAKPKKPMGALEGEDDIHQEDFDEKIREAAASGNFRLATRYLFLKALRLADESKLIRYHPQLTNYEYVQQLAGHPQKESFRMLSNAYEHVWYGGFLLADAQYEWLQQQFEKFNKSVQS